MCETIINVILSIVCIVIWIIRARGPNADINPCEIIGYLTPIILLILKITRNIKKISAWFWISVIKKSKLRVSLAYIFEIKVDNKYLLVRNRKTGKYQPVGGKYHYYNDSQLRAMNFTPDRMFQTNDSNDLAGEIPVNEYDAFFKWFTSEKDREIDHYREFYEELIINKETKEEILDKKIFSRIDLKKIRTVRTKIHKTVRDGKRFYEVLQYDYYEPIFTDDQKQALQQLKQKGDSNYIKWVNNTDIEKLTYKIPESDQEFHISEHTLWCYNGNYSKEN
ncbi:MAG: hypothetical protein VZQ47_11395 [Treponema sp.]|nr:hypothetical protein [Treponema sp.]MEE3436147.1 hypothetical protein [Treponema sp.]